MHPAWGVVRFVGGSASCVAAVGDRGATRAGIARGAVVGAMRGEQIRLARQKREPVHSAPPAREVWFGGA